MEFKRKKPAIPEQLLGGKKIDEIEEIKERYKPGKIIPMVDIKSHEAELFFQANRDIGVLLTQVEELEQKFSDKCESLTQTEEAWKEEISLKKKAESLLTGAREEIDRRIQSVIYFQDALRDVIRERDKAEEAVVSLLKLIDDGDYYNDKVCEQARKVLGETKRGGKDGD